MRWKRAGKINIVADPVKLEIKAIKSAKCGIKIAGRRVRKFVATRMPINQTIRGILSEKQSSDTDSSIICMIDITKKGYEKTTLKIKEVLTRVRITPMGRLLEITSWMLGLKDKNANTENITFMMAAKKESKSEHWAILRPVFHTCLKARQSRVTDIIIRDNCQRNRCTLYIPY